jgi:hypothetical protein
MPKTDISSAQYLDNYGFEDGFTGTELMHQGVPLGWQGHPVEEIVLVKNENLQWGNIKTTDGGYFVALNKRYTKLWQNMTHVKMGQYYRVSFVARAAHPDNLLVWGPPAGPVLLSVKVGTQVMVHNVMPSPDKWERMSFIFRADHNHATLFIENTSPKPVEPHHCKVLYIDLIMVHPIEAPAIANQYYTAMRRLVDASGTIHGGTVGLNVANGAGQMSSQGMWVDAQGHQHSVKNGQFCNTPHCCQVRCKELHYCCTTDIKKSASGRFSCYQACVLKVMSDPVAMMGMCQGPADDKYSGTNPANQYKAQFSSSLLEDPHPKVAASVHHHHRGSYQYGDNFSNTYSGSNYPWIDDTGKANVRNAENFSMDMMGGELAADGRGSRLDPNLCTFTPSDWRMPELSLCQDKCEDQFQCKYDYACEAGYAISVPNPEYSIPMSQMRLGYTGVSHAGESCRQKCNGRLGPCPGYCGRGASCCQSTSDPGCGEMHVAMESLVPEGLPVLPKNLLKDVCVPTAPANTSLGRVQPSRLTCQQLGWTHSLGYVQGVGSSSNGLAPDGKLYIQPEFMQEMHGKEIKQCPSRMPWADADRFCRDGGARLCSAMEISRNVGRHAGCGFDNKRVWTSTVCGQGMGFRSAAASTDFLSQTPELCTPVSDHQYPQCCCDEMVEQCGETGVPMADVVLCCGNLPHSCSMRVGIANTENCNDYCSGHTHSSVKLECSGAWLPADNQSCTYGGAITCDTPKGNDHEHLICECREGTDDFGGGTWTAQRGSAGSGNYYWFHNRGSASPAGNGTGANHSSPSWWYQGSHWGNQPQQTTQPGQQVSGNGWFAAPSPAQVKQQEAQEQAARNQWGQMQLMKDAHDRTGVNFINYTIGQHMTVDKIPQYTYEALLTSCQNSRAISVEFKAPTLEQCKQMCNEFRAGDCIAFDYTEGACFLMSWCEGTVDKFGQTCKGLCGYRNADYQSSKQERSLETFFLTKYQDALAKNTLNVGDTEYETLGDTCENAVSTTTNLHVSSIGECKTLCNDVGVGNCIAINTDGFSCYLLSHCDGAQGSCTSTAPKTASTSKLCSYRLNGRNHVEGGSRIASPGQNGPEVNYNQTKMSNWSYLTDSDGFNSTEPYDETNYIRLTSECKNSVSLMLPQAVSSIAECESMCIRNYPDTCVAIESNGKSCVLLSHCEGEPGFCNAQQMCGYVLVTKATAPPSTTTTAAKAPQQVVQQTQSFIEDFDDMDDGSAFEDNGFKRATWIKAHHTFSL